MIMTYFKPLHYAKNTVESLGGEAGKIAGGLLQTEFLQMPEAAEADCGALFGQGG